MYSAMYAGVGALCSSMQDAQNYQFPIMAMVIIPMLMLAVAMKSPDSAMSGRAARTRSSCRSTS